jgi:hypothetical protein
MIMMRKWVGLGMLVAAAFAANAQATQISLDTDGSWNAFDVDDLTSAGFGVEWIDLGDGSPLSFAFTSATDVRLTVVDAGFAGDRFNVFDNGNPLGVTGTATDSYPASLVLDFDTALATPGYSSAVFLLAAGSHVITGDLFASAHGPGGAELNATVGGLKVAPVPLPASLLLLLSGGGLLGALRRRGVRNVEVQS